MKFKRIYSSVLTVLMAAGTAQAAPAVTGSSGSLQRGQTLVLQGSSFGSREDFNPASDKMARMFDTFSDSSIDDNPYEKWTVFNIEENIAKVVTGGRAGGSDGFYRRNNTGLGNLYLQGGDHDEYFTSFYMRLSDNFDVSGGGGTHQFKITRLSSRNSDINLYPAIGAEDGFHMVAEFIEPVVTRYQLQMDDIPDVPKGWHKMTIYYKKSSSRNANNGKCKVWWDNKLVFDWAEHFKNPKNNPDYAPGYPITGDFDTDGADLAGEWTIGNYFSSASGDTWADFDDVVLDHTLARVEFGNAPTYAACTTLEIQEPASWSNNSVTVKANLGLLNTSAPVYAYVTDAKGNVNANGFLWGGGSPVTQTPEPEPEPQPQPQPQPKPQPQPPMVKPPMPPSEPRGLRPL